MLYRENKNGGNRKISFSISTHLRLHISIAKFLIKKRISIFYYIPYFSDLLQQTFFDSTKLKLKLLKLIPIRI